MSKRRANRRVVLTDTDRLAHQRARLREDMVYRDPKVMGGDAVIRGTRIPVWMIVDRYEAGNAWWCRVAWPELTVDEVRAAVRYALHVDPEGVAADRQAYMDAIPEEMR